MIANQHSVDTQVKPMGQLTGKVLLVHCSASSPKQWARLEECFPPGFDVCAWALTGHGERDAWSGNGPLTIRAEAEEISEQFTNSDSPLHVVGHSYGGAVALHFVLHNPHIAHSLTLFEPVCFYLLKDCANDAGAYQEVRSVARDLGASIIQGDYYAGMQRFVDYWSGTGSWNRLSSEQKLTYSARAVHIAPHFEALFNEDITLEDCASLRVPTLILSGSESPKPTRRISELLGRKLPVSHHEVVEGAGHMAPITHAQPVNSFIIEHVLRNSTRRADLCRSYAAGPDVNRSC